MSPTGNLLITSFFVASETFFLHVSVRQLICLQLETCLSHQFFAICLQQETSCHIRFCSETTDMSPTGNLLITSFFVASETFFLHVSVRQLICLQLETCLSHHFFAICLQQETSCHNNFCSETTDMSPTGDSLITSFFVASAAIFSPCISETTDMSPTRNLLVTSIFCDMSPTGDKLSHQILQ